MKIFSSDSRTVVAWGPTASVDVRVEAMGSLVDESWVLTDVAIGAREIVDVRQCFKDVSYIYALGNNQSSCRITLSFAVFIGTKNCKGKKSNAQAIADGLDIYVKNRVSSIVRPGVITIGGFSRMGWLIGIDIGGLNPEMGVCKGTVDFIMELKGGAT